MAIIMGADLRGYLKNQKVDDDPILNEAAAVASEKVEELCGPVTPVRTVTDKRVRSSLRYRPAALVAVETYVGAYARDLADYDFDGQTIFRRDGGRITELLTVTYTAGWEPEDVPASLTAAAKAIAQQYLATTRRFGQTADGPTGFLVPKAALEEMEGYLLAPGGFA